MNPLSALPLLLLAAAALPLAAQVNILPANLPNGALGSEYGTQRTGLCQFQHDPVFLTLAGAAGEVEWVVQSGSLPAGMQALPRSGGSYEIFGEPSETGSFSFTVLSQDSRGQRATRQYTIRVTRPFACRVLQIGRVGSSFRNDFSCLDGTGYSIPSGELPPGVMLDPQTGNLFGIPTREGSYSAEWQCESRVAGLRSEFNFRVGPPPSFSFAGAVGSEFEESYDLGPGSTPFSLEVVKGELPPGIAADAARQVLSGTPGEAGRHSFWMQRTDARGLVDSGEFSILVLPAGELPLTVRPRRLSFSAGPNDAGPLRQRMAVEAATRLDVAFEAAAETRSGGDWLSVDPSNGTASLGEFRVLQVIADPSGLAPGAYLGRIRLTAEGRDGFIDVPVTLVVRSLQDELRFAPGGLTFDLEEGASGLLTSQFRILGLRGLPATAELSARTTDGQEWLRVAPPAVAAANAPLLTINPAGLAAGVYYGFVDVALPGAANSPRTFAVVLNLRPREQPVPPLVEPGGAVLVAAAGETLTRSFLLTSRSNQTIEYSAAATTEDGGGWLDSGRSGSVGAGEAVQHEVTISADGLAAGVYRGSVDLIYGGGESQRLRIALVVRPGSAATGFGATGGKQQACSASQTVPGVTNLGDASTPTSGQPQPITVQVVDNCGKAMSGGTVTAVFGGVDSPPVTLEGEDGEFAGTWTPPALTEPGGAALMLTSLDLSGNLGLTAETVTVQPNSASPPAIGGVAHAASFEGEPLAPGTMVSIFGSGLSAAPLAAGQIAPSLPLPTELAGTRITLGGQPLPLLFVREDQVNAILPFELGDQAIESLGLVVERTDTLAASAPQLVQLSATRPGVFTQSGTGAGAASILDVAFQLVDETNPVAPGEAIQIFAAGLGPVAPAVVTAEAAPGSPLAQATKSVSVTIGGAAAEVLFAGLSPGFAGLFQVNAIVPGGAPPGDAALVIAVDGLPSQEVSVPVE